MAGAASFLLMVYGSQKDKEGCLKVPFAPNGPASHYDPYSINYASDISFLENVLSPLVEYSPEGELVSGLAARFGWEGNSAWFEFRPGVRTIDGFSVDAYDAELSFKRLFLKGGEKYAFMQDLLCGEKSLKTVSDACRGLEVRDNGRRLVLKFDRKRTFLFPLLTSAYFSVVPRRSFDAKTLEITDYRNTSGPYYVESDSPEGEIRLKANPFHYRYSKEMPLAVCLKPIKDFKPEAILDLLSEGEGDYLLFDIARYPDAKMAYARGNRGFRLHLTHPIRGVYAVFTQRGMKRLTAEERRFIGKKLRESFGRLHPGYEVPEQIFTFEGGLSPDQLTRLRALMSAAPASGAVDKPLVAWRLFNYFGKEKGEIEKWLPGIKSFGSDGLPGFVDYGKAGLEEPDFYIAGSDIGLQEDIGLLSYYLDLEFFDIPKNAKKKWLKNYVDAADKRERMTMLRELQYKTLLSGAVIPISVHPYAALVRDEWDFDLTRMNTSNPVWRLRRR